MTKKQKKTLNRIIAAAVLTVLLAVELIWLLSSRPAPEGTAQEPQEMAVLLHAVQPPQPLRRPCTDRQRRVGTPWRCCSGGSGHHPAGQHRDYRRKDL